jgi:hypothetical protein
MFSAQYQQQPVPVEGNLIRQSWFPAYDNQPAGPSLSRIVQSWDVAMKTGDQNDCTLLAREHSMQLSVSNRSRVFEVEIKTKT